MINRKRVKETAWVPIQAHSKAPPICLFADRAKTRSGAMANWRSVFADREDKGMPLMKAQMAAGWLRFAKVTIIEHPPAQEGGR